MTLAPMAPVPTTPIVLPSSSKLRYSGRRISGTVLDFDAAFFTVSQIHVIQTCKGYCQHLQVLTLFQHLPRKRQIAQGNDIRVFASLAKLFHVRRACIIADDFMFLHNSRPRDFKETLFLYRQRFDHYDFHNLFLRFTFSLRSTFLVSNPVSGNKKSHALSVL